MKSGTKSLIFSLNIAEISLLSSKYIQGHKLITLCEYQSWILLIIYNNYFYMNFKIIFNAIKLMNSCTKSLIT